MQRYSCLDHPDLRMLIISNMFVGFIRLSITSNRLLKFWIRNLASLSCPLALKASNSAPYYSSTPSTTSSSTYFCAWSYHHGQQLLHFKAYYKLIYVNGIFNILSQHKYLWDLLQWSKLEPKKWPLLCPLQRSCSFTMDHYMPIPLNIGKP